MTANAPPRWRRGLRWTLFGLGALVAAYLVGVNLLLNIGLGRALVNLRPATARLSWRSAWTLFPGHLAVRGFEIRGQMRSRAWSVGIERADASWAVLALLRRELRFTRLQADGVASQVRRVSYTPAPGTKPTGGPATAAPPPQRLRTWRFTFAGIDARRVGEVELFGLVVDCAGGEMSGAFGYQIAGEFHIADGRAACRGGQLRAGSHVLVRDTTITAEADMAPYSPRRHPGLQGFDFLSGRLEVRGAAESAALLARVGKEIVAGGEGGANGALTVDLRLESGALAPGSTLRLAASADAPSLSLLVSGDEAATELTFVAPSLEIPGPAAAADESRPLLAAGATRFTGSARTRRLSRLFAATRALRNGDDAEGLGLRGELEMEEPRLHVGGPQATVGFEAARLSGTVDLAGLLSRQIWVENLVIEAPAARFAPKEATPRTSEEAPWTLVIRDAALRAVREIHVAEYALQGPFDVALTGGLSPSEGFELQELKIAAPRLDLFAAGTPVSRGARLDIDVRMAPFFFDVTSAKEGLRGLSGELHFAGRVESLGLLRRFLRRMPWLQIDGRGDLAADVALRDGNLLDGSRIRLTRGALRAQILDNVASGAGTLQAAVQTADGKPRVAIDVVFTRFGLASEDGERAYVHGSNLRLALVSGDVGLTDLVEDLRARVEVRGAQIPDLRAYNAYLPPGAGLQIRSGAGVMGLALDLDYAAKTAHGTFGVASPDVVVEFADVELRGRMELDSRLASTDLDRRRFDLAGTRLLLDDVEMHETGEEASPEGGGWWARLELPRGHVDVTRPLALEADAEMRMKDTGFLLSVASRRKRFLSWFRGVLDEEDVTAKSRIAIADGVIRIDPLRAEGGKLDLRARMRMEKGSRRIDVYLKHGVLAAGLELRDGKRDIKLLRPESWYESRADFD